MTLAASELRLLHLFSAAVLGRFDELARVRREAGAGEPDRSWREILLQVHVFAGFPRAVECYAVLEAEGGLGTPSADEFERSDPGTDARRGQALFERIYAQDSASVRGMLARAHPEHERWILEHAYGRVLARPGLEPRLRELAAVCALAALGQERQLASHVRGALRCGATREELESALLGLAGLVEPERIERAGRVLERFGAG